MKILIGLIEHFGDVVACEPVSRYVRLKYPQAHIAWAILKPYRELIDTNPYIDEAVIVECLTGWIQLSKHQRYDLLFDLHVNYRHCETCRVPLVKERGNPFVNAYEWFDYGALLEAFCIGAGLPKLSAQPQLYLTDEHRKAVDALELPGQYCVIHRESNLASKDWPDEKWSILVRFLVKQCRLSVVEVGMRKPPAHSDPRNGNVKAITEPRPRPLGPPVIDLLNRTTLLETAEVIRRARLYIGIDSGPAHLANAVKTPGIVLLGQLGFFKQYTPFTGFYAGRSPEVRLVRNLTGIVAEIETTEVVEAVRYLTQVLEDRDVRCKSAVLEAKKEVTSSLDPLYRRMVADSGFFDPVWYAVHHPEAVESGQDLLDYFISVGALQGHSPGGNFDAPWYTKQRPDLVVVRDSLQHYLRYGREEGLRTHPDRKSGASELPPTEEAIMFMRQGENALQGQPADWPGTSMPRIFAFYLPQFHPIAENNFGHRPGFTEWDNVINAKPRFKGHYQPRIPGELGYYDLRSVDVMREQVQLANDHGIAGFCFYYYYFHGKKLLYKPIENYIQSDLQAPFFFLWANENWSRRWDGGDHEVIISQSHSPEDDLIFIRELFTVFADPRYAKVSGKPILAIYKTHLFPDIKRSADLWRDEVAKQGFPGLYLIMVDDWTSDPCHPRERGFDASYEIPSNLVPEEVLSRYTDSLRLKPGFEGRIVDYPSFASFHMSRPDPNYRRFRTVMAPWDNTPRYGARAMIHVNTDNDAYLLWLFNALLKTQTRYPVDEQIVFLHSWNEWCEGTYVEPDGRHGRRLLQQTKEAVDLMYSVLCSRCGEAEPKTLEYFRRMTRETDVGVARSIQALRQQTMYVYREMEHQQRQYAQALRNAEANLEDALRRAQNSGPTSDQLEAEALLQQVYASKSWRLTQPMRAFARMFKK